MSGQMSNAAKPASASAMPPEIDSEADGRGSGTSPAQIAAARKLLAEVNRDEGREDHRDFIRHKPREPHEKFELPKNAKVPRGMDFMWGSLRIPYSTQRNPRLSQFRQAGWQFARAADFPELSGYKPEAEVNQRFIELGIDQEVRPDDPVVMDNQSVLMMRPKTLSQQAETEDKRRAATQINDFLTTQRKRSVAAIGEGRTRMTRTYGPGGDEAPSDAEVEI